MNITNSWAGKRSAEDKTKCNEHKKESRARNPDIEKYLCNTRSVDKIEWVRYTCNNYVAENVPPCAVGNGMKFDQSKLVCILVAPRIAFLSL